MNRITAQQQRLARVLEQLGEKQEVLEDLEIEETFGRRQAATYLGVTESQFYSLMQHPALRSKNQIWSRMQLDRFKAKLEYCKQRKWKVPDCLFGWE
jgi:hypothetical protein